VPSWDYGLYDYGCSYSYPNTMVTAATRPHTDVCQHESRHRKDKPRIILAGLVPWSVKNSLAGPHTSCAATV
jgi:hypothetical protein